MTDCAKASSSGTDPGACRKFARKFIFWKYLALDVTDNCIWESPCCLVLDWFDLNTVSKLSCKEKKNLNGAGFEPGTAKWKAKVLPP